ELASIINDLAPKNRALLDKRDELQTQINQWHLARKDQDIDLQKYKSFLSDIGYLATEGEPYRVSVAKTDDEITKIAGPQLVVPVDNSRYAINAANARWGSLYDALYSTDIILEVDG
ncbi:MAG TPA: malate synthase G, partial [Dehalococcoidia bacterium]|nr:malate synthase G [Dehalococcoidia bacterium]